MVSRATGIDGFDEVLEGGIPEGHTVLVAGDSGTGKTLLAMQWLFQGCNQYGDRGIYLTMTETVTSAVDNLDAFEFADSSTFESDRLHFVDLRSTLELIEAGNTLDSTGMADLLDAIRQVVEEVEADRIVIDSITALAHLMESESHIREFVFELGAMLASKDVTTLLTSEVADGEGYSVFGVEEFICDGIILMEQSWRADQNRRLLTVVKMRGTDYYAERIPFVIDESGINLSRWMPSTNSPVSSSRESTGVPGLDEMMGGGLFTGTFTLVTGPSGTGKTTTGLHFIHQGLENKASCVYVSFEDSRSKLVQQADLCSIPLEQAKDSDSFAFLTRRPGDSHPEQHLDSVMSAVKDYDADRLVVDSLSAIRHTHGDDALRGFARKLVPLLKERDVTALATTSHSSLIGMESVGQSQLSTLPDSTVMFQYIEKDGQLSRSVAVVKTIGWHDPEFHEYAITDHGLEIGATLRGYSGVSRGVVQKEDSGLMGWVREIFR